ncbi:Trk system potassium transporter TrkA [Chitinibacteraceae bacterium HSL-7]
MGGILILGAGRVGSSVAEQLVSERYAVTIVDEDPLKLAQLQDRLDLRTVRGHATDPDVLEAAGIRDVDLLLAITQLDEVNLVACKMAHTLYNVPLRLARIRNQKLLTHPLFSHDGFAVDEVITPAQIVSDYLARLAHTPEALQVVAFGDGAAKLVVTRVLPSAPMAGAALALLEQSLPGIDCRVVGIYRRNRYIQPDGDSRIEAGDEVFVLAAKRDIRQVIAAFHPAESRTKRVLISGGGNVGMRLAQALADEYQVKVIEKNAERAQMLAELLPNVMVLAGDATDETLLEDEQVDRSDLYLALTSDDEDNIMSGLLAKQMGARKVVSLINRSRYVSLLQGSRIDVAISPAQATIGSILAFVRRGDIVATHNLRRGKAEVLEIIAHGSRATSRIVGRSVADLRLPDGIFFAAVIRGDTVLMLHSDTEIADGDHVIVFVDNKRRIREVEQLFAVKLGFL